MEGPEEGRGEAEKDFYGFSYSKRGEELKSISKDARLKDFAEWCYLAEKKGEEPLRWKRLMYVEGIVKGLMVVFLLVCFTFCVTLLFVHIDNYTKKKMGYGQKDVSLLDLYRVEYRNELEELTRGDNFYWFYVAILSLCLYAICSAIMRRNEAHDEVAHWAVLRRYFYAIALQDLRRYRADANHEDVAIQKWLAALTTKKRENRRT